MRKVLLVAAFFLAVSAMQAQEDSQFKKDAIELIKAQGTVNALKSLVGQFGSMVPADKKEAFSKDAEKTFEGLYNKYADLYMKEFTHEELKEMIKFYSSKVGKKLANKNLDLSQKGAALGQAWAMEVQALVQKYSQ